MKRILWVVAITALVAACDSSTIQKPGPDTGTNDTDQTAGGDTMVNDDGQLINDDGELVNDDGELVNDDGQVVNDDGEPITDEVVPDETSDETPDEASDEVSPDEDIPVGECSTNGQCLETEMCQKVTGQCNAGYGTCEKRPEGCNEIYAPVCGCDENTYGNECLAHGAGVNVLYEGECGTATVCLNNDGCGETEYCARPDGTCDVLGSGTCARRPTEEECWMYSAIIYVCGCDGNTYQHPCFAQAAGVNIAYEGECGSVVTCKTDIECGDFVAMLCQKATGVCEEGTGTCVIPETGCNMIYAPVCGCDGNTYDNECLAHASFMNVAYEGECGGGGYSSLYYYYSQELRAPTASVVIVDGDTTVSFDGAELVSREATGQYVYLRTTFYGPEGGGVVELQLRLNAGASIPATATLDGVDSYARWTNFYSGGVEEVIGNLYGEVTISQYNRNSNTITLIEMSGDQLNFINNE